MSGTVPFSGGGDAGRPDQSEGSEMIATAVIGVFRLVRESESATGIIPLVSIDVEKIAVVIARI